MTTDNEVSNTTRSAFGRTMRKGRTAVTTVVVGAAAAAAIMLGTGVASASDAYPSVIGMTAEDAHATLDAAGVDYQTLVSIGSGSTCTITQVFDMGNQGDSWNGLGLWQNCS